MAHKKNTTNLTELLLQCVTQPDPMLSMPAWLCTHLMEAEVDQQLGAEKSRARTEEADTAAAIVHAAWIPGWEQCTSWCPRFVRAATFRSSSQSASAVKRCSYR